MIIILAICFMYIESTDWWHLLWQVADNNTHMDKCHSIIIHTILQINFLPLTLKLLSANNYPLFCVNIVAPFIHLHSCHTIISISGVKIGGWSRPWNFWHKTWHIHIYSKKFSRYNGINLKYQWIRPDPKYFMFPTIESVGWGNIYFCFQ